MGKRVLWLGFSLLAMAGAALAQGDSLPYWAYPVMQPPSSLAGAQPPKLDDTVKHHVPGSRASFTEAGTNDRFHVPDWHPEGHPTMPEIISSGKQPDVFACGYCHLPTGKGRPENAPLAGQSAVYIVEQVGEMKEGRRKSSGAMGSVNTMMKIAAAVSPQDLKIAAAYFAKLHYGKWIRVVETEDVPVSEISSHNMIVKAPGTEHEKLGARIIEMPENLERTELRDTASGFVAYVPVGSIARGRKLVTDGAGAAPCASCHGASLHGDGAVPALAGRSPSYIVRQLYDFQHGARAGTAADPMKTEVAGITPANRLDIAAYLASRNP